MDLKTILIADGETHVFFAKAHISRKKKDLLMDQKMFYKACYRLPKFPHFEIEILTPVWEEIFARQILYYFSEKHNKYFIYWPFRIKNAEEAKKIFNIWSLGTLYTIYYGKDFVEEIEKAEKFFGKQEFFPAFQKFMEEKYGIKFLKLA